MKIGDRFWVSDYFMGQDGLVEFEVREFASEFGTQYYLANKVEAGPNSRVYWFYNNKSLDVLSARVYKTQQEVAAYHAKQEDYERRKAEAMKIFPEGFE